MIWMQRIAVAVERSNRKTPGLEQFEIVISRGIAGQNIGNRKVSSRKKPPTIDFGSIETKVDQRVQRRLNVAVMKHGCVSGKTHQVTISVVGILS
jgi:hypothetical protein